MDGYLVRNPAALQTRLEQRPLLRAVAPDPAFQLK
jgi:hypothetical protein